jgi:outer membrane biosynthesis protein TonB
MTAQFSATNLKSGELAMKTKNSKKISPFTVALILGIGLASSLKLAHNVPMQASRFAFLGLLDEDKSKLIRPTLAARTHAAPQPIRPTIATTSTPKSNEEETTETPVTAVTPEPLKPGKAIAKIEDKNAKKKKAKNAKNDKKKVTVPGAVVPIDQNPQMANNQDAEAQKHINASDAASSAPSATFNPNGRMNGSASGAPPAHSSNQEVMPKTPQEWAKYVLQQPNFNHTTRLIKIYQAHGVGANVFYTIVTKMLQDNDPKMREQGVMALGSTPSPTSFDYLVAFQHTEDASSNAAAQTQVYLKTYSLISNLHYLVVVLNTTKSADSSIAALALIQVATAQYLGSGQPSQASPAPAAQNIASAFSPFISVLTQMTQAASDGTVRSAAGQALNNLQNLMGRS